MEKKSLSVGKRLETILDDAEKEAQQLIIEAQRKKDVILSKAAAEAEEKRVRAQRGLGIDTLIREEEKKVQNEAEAMKSDFKKKLDTFSNIPKKKKEAVIEMVVKEVLPQ